MNGTCWHRMILTGFLVIPGVVWADTIWWSSGNLWHNATTLEVLHSATGTIALVEHDGQRGWWSGLSAIEFEAAGAEGRSATVTTADSTRVVTLHELTAGDLDATLRATDSGRSVHLPRWRRVQFADVRPATQWARPTETPPPAGIVIEPPAPPVSDEPADVELLPNIDGKVRPPAGWRRIQLGNEDATYAWRWTAPREAYPGFTPTITLRARPFRAGGSGRLSMELLSDHLRGHFSKIIQLAGLTQSGMGEQRFAQAQGREWMFVMAECQDAQGNPRTIAFAAFAGREYLHIWTLICARDQWNSVRKIFNHTYQSYEVGD